MNIVSRFTVEKKLQYQSDESFRNNINFILTFISIVIFGLFAIRPSIMNITALLKDIDEYRQVNGVLLEKTAILNEVQSNPERTAKETELIANALPDSPQESVFIRNLNFIASKNSVELESVFFYVAEEEKLGTLGFSVTAYGQYPDMTQFISDINHLLRITTIENLSISPIKESDRSVKTTISGKAYFLDPK